MKSLIIYATKYGTVEKASNLIKDKMKGEVVMVNILKQEPPSTVEFDNIILGGSIYIGNIQKKLKQFAINHEEELLMKRVGLFICGGADKEEEKYKELKNAFPSKLFENAICKCQFGYEYKFEKLNFFEKAMIKKITGIKDSVYKLSEESIEKFTNIMNESI
ncbi:flavodoxin [Clostridium sp. YIM B02505]|uniref:Flavodoxin n=1 Tax=Clostridium yunnanense TaxID=2800325 RepID=A0ABS1EMQ9_9CLOT|nr:flavodoxin domain-containing protein [Clostridium yunnanense]MBK1810583.1 flavodoxin [Clostridium yunnanense]